MSILRHIFLWSCAAALCGCGSQAPDPAKPAAEKSGAVETGLGSTTVLLDVRSAEEFGSGHLRGAVNIPHDRIVERIAEVAADKSTPIILYCRSGRRADTALNALKAAGYENVTNYGGLEDAQMRLTLPVVSE